MGMDERMVDWMKIADGWSFRRKSSLARSNVGGLARGWSARAARGGKDSGGSGDEGEFHVFGELVF